GPAQPAGDERLRPGAARPLLDPVRPSVPARERMRLLVLHQNFPGQFRALVQAWAARPGWEVRALGRDSAPGLPGFAGFARYALARKGRPGQHPYLRQMEAATLHGQAVA